MHHRADGKVTYGYSLVRGKRFTMEDCVFAKVCGGFRNVLGCEECEKWRSVISVVYNGSIECRCGGDQHCASINHSLQRSKTKKLGCLVSLMVRVQHRGAARCVHDKPHMYAHTTHHNPQDTVVQQQPSLSREICFAICLPMTNSLVMTL